MNGIEWALFIIIFIIGFVLGLGTAWDKANKRWPYELRERVPDTMIVGDVDYAFSPTGGYVHVIYKPKEGK